MLWCKFALGCLEYWGTLKMRVAPKTQLSLIALLLSFGFTVGASAQTKVPYWASIDKSEARMRTGPSTDYPTLWVYQREKLPLKILARYKSWRKVEDPDGTQGWMHVRLLTPKRTAVIIGETAMLRAAPDNAAPVSWRAQTGVVGEITNCEAGWCLFDVRGRKGFVLTSSLWGSGEL